MIYVINFKLIFWFGKNYLLVNKKITIDNIRYYYLIRYFILILGYTITLLTPPANNIIFIKPNLSVRNIILFL